MEIVALAAGWDWTIASVAGSRRWWLSSWRPVLLSETVIFAVLPAWMVTALVVPTLTVLLCALAWLAAADRVSLIAQLVPGAPWHVTDAVTCGPLTLTLLTEPRAGEPGLTARTGCVGGAGGVDWAGAAAVVRGRSRKLARG